MAEARFLLDTNICIYIINGQIPLLRNRVESVPLGAAVTSTIVMAELLIGTDFQDRRLLHRSFSLLKVVFPLPFDHAAALTYSSLPIRRRSFDRLIAAHALSLDLTVVTANPRDFEDIPDLAVEDWTKP